MRVGPVHLPLLYRSMYIIQSSVPLHCYTAIVCVFVVWCVVDRSLDIAVGVGSHFGVGDLSAMALHC